MELTEWTMRLISCLAGLALLVAAGTAQAAPDSGDLQFGAVVEKKCEADFLDHLKAPQKLTYQRELRVCDRKYRNESGTMYISFAAFCRAEVAQRYSRQSLKAAR
jgi:hypothetical protein